MRIVNNEFLYRLNTRGWLCFILCAINLIHAFFFAFNGSWMSLLSLAVSIILWISLYDKRNQKLDLTEFNKTNK